MGAATDQTIGLPELTSVLSRSSSDWPMDYRPSGGHKMPLFKVGDVVQLKSGGPKMTVKRLEEDKAYCEWLEGTEIQGTNFALTQLIHPLN
jgi:uncharacterized protein YodC (DUF2158 family)